MDVAVRRVVRPVHSLVLLVYVADVNFPFSNPFLDELPGVVRRPVVNHQPLEVLACLPAKALVGSPDGARPVVGRSENSKSLHNLNALKACECTW